MEIISIGSSSSGNSYIIRAGSCNLLLDVGLSGAKIMNALSECQIDPCDVDAVLITHEHVDHVKSIRTIANKCCNARIIASKGTIRKCSNFQHVDSDRIYVASSQDKLHLGDLTDNEKCSGVWIKCFGLSHDAAEPIGYSVAEAGKQLTVVTDTGVITEEIYDEMLNADLLVFEANHEERLLMMSEYPYQVKMRIKSDYGHLSNASASDVLARLMNDRQGGKLDIMLAHLSEKNNLPSEALGRIQDTLTECGYLIGEDYSLSVALKEGLTYL